MGVVSHFLGVGADYFKWVCKNKLSNNSSSSVGGMLSKASGAIGSKGAKKGGYETCVCMYVCGWVCLFVCVFMYVCVSFACQ